MANYIDVSRETKLNEAYYGIHGVCYHGMRRFNGSWYITIGEYMKKTITLKNVKLYKPKSKPNEEGIKVEMEHTPQKRVARIIQGNHDDEFKAKKGGKPPYYPALKKMEKKIKGKK